jgi:hypothetical protein
MLLVQSLRIEIMDEENQVVEKTPEQVAVEKEARLLGWVDKSEYRDGEHWVDAETFVKRGKEINPILRKNNETLLKKLAERDREIAEVKAVAAEFKKFTKDAAERKVKELETQIKELREQKKTAVTQGDGEAVVALDDAIDEIKEQQRAAKAEVAKPEPKPQPETLPLDPDLVSWMEENTWFGSDMKMTRVADAIGVEIAQSYPALQGKAFLEKLNEELEEVLPAKYKKTQRANLVEGNTTSANRPTASRSKHSYENLPSDAKAACDRYVKQGLMTKEQYVEEYDWD